MGYKKNDLYRLNEGDTQIFEASKDEPSYFTNFYLRNNLTGTWWFPGAKTQHWGRGYTLLKEHWRKMGEPEEFVYEGKAFQCEWAHDMSSKFPNKPAFFNNHGFIFLPYQRELHINMHPIRTIVGGFGCIAAETRIYDVEQDKHIPVGQMEKDGYAPTVLAWTGTQFIKAKATIPFVKGQTDLYRVQMKSGRSVTVTSEHIFLTNHRWRRTADLASGHLLVSCAFHSQSSLVSDPLGFQPDGQHWSRTVPNYRGDCFVYRRQCDEQPLLQSGDDKVVFPLHNGVLGCSQWCENLDDWAYTKAHSHFYPENDRLSSRGVYHQAVRHVGQFASLGCGESDEAALSCFLSLADSTPQVSRGYSYPVLQNGQFGHNKGQTDLASEPLGSSFLDEIVSIEWVGEGEFYDLHVPVWNNYVAEGIVHHNSGKTMGAAVSLLINAATLVGYRGFGLAPYSLQAEEMYRVMLMLITDTEYEKRFLVASPSRPNPKLVIGNDLVGLNTIEFYPILGNSEKIRTLTGDEAVIDQAEKLNGGGEIEEVVRSIGTRFRGRVMKGGRGRLGRLTFVANADDNQELWDMYDRAEVDPDNYYSISPTSYDNIYLTDADIHRFEMQVGNSKELKDQYMLGHRPLGNGSVFSRAVQESIRDTELDARMHKGKASGKFGFIDLTAHGVGTYEWLLPPEPNRKYLVVSDPGTANPPKRDTGVIMVWDITGFPGKEQRRLPAKLIGFIWVYGNGDIKNWADRYAETVRMYNAIGSNAFDATGFQSGYDEWLAILQGLLSEKINLGGNNKYLVINAGKVLSSHGMVKAPASINMLYAQMAKYEVPEPLKLRQDIVITFCMSCWWLQRLYFFNPQEESDEKSPFPTTRHWRRKAKRYPVRRAR